MGPQQKHNLLLPYIPTHHFVAICIFTSLTDKCNFTLIFSVFLTQIHASFRRELCVWYLLLYRARIQETHIFMVQKKVEMNKDGSKSAREREQLRSSDASALDIVKEFYSKVRLLSAQFWASVPVIGTSAPKPHKNILREF